jgi:hypothetical protein
MCISGMVLQQLADKALLELRLEHIICLESPTITVQPTITAQVVELDHVFALRVAHRERRGNIAHPPNC